ncbi:Hpt domain-containing protein [Nitrosomonas aestuarii]|uniref:Hpt domain-containing protein n=1 Tax=Nitrosomonas aestuarii TaxID=52441 RepID=UPI000D3081B7|nr:Hpt domain-containing protein [Nitrosomonas aestuarii]PTN11078.1 HPt (histidine-containing phosphotransfer) domain-containing protein [Nitrosomonas aestuarii]
MDTVNSCTASDRVNTPILNQEQLTVIRNLDLSCGDELVNKILQVFLETSVDLTRQIEDAINNEDAESLRHAAHTLKSSAANVGAESISVIAQKLELCGKSGEFGQVGQLLDNLQQRYQKVITEIKQILKQS